MGGANHRGDSSLDELVYQSRWQRQPLPQHREVRRNEVDLPNENQLAAAVGGKAQKLRWEGNLGSRHAKFQSDINRLCAQYACAAFRQLGFRPEIGRQFSADILAEELRIIPEQRRIAERFLKWLVEDGVLTFAEGAWEIVQPFPVDDPGEWWRTLLFRHPVFLPELTLLRRCGPALDQVLRGEIDPLQLIFPEGSLSNAEQL